MNHEALVGKDFDYKLYKSRRIRDIKESIKDHNILDALSWFDNTKAEAYAQRITELTADVQGLQVVFEIVRMMSQYSNEYAEKEFENEQQEA